MSEIISKINSYSIQLEGRPLDVVNRNLWFSSSSSDIEVYAAAVENSSANPMGDNAVIAYSMIGSDNRMKTLRDGTTIGIVNSPAEYYFTDMVFIQQKYEEALIDLYYYRAEVAWNRTDSLNVNNRPAVDEAIAGTYWVAQQNGVILDEKAMEDAFIAEIQAKLQPLEDKFIRDFGNKIDNVELNIKKLTESICDYYRDPSEESFGAILDTAVECGEDFDTPILDWLALLQKTISEICLGLYLALRRLHRTREELAHQVSPVEVSKNEQAVVFTKP